tara:strand:+ start:657 stop:1829 length:1173 start_codon:yes stop_codon:yes gene_type:complete
VTEIKNNFPIWPKFNKNDEVSINRILKTGKVNYWTGNYNTNFEREFAKYHDSKYAIAVSNGSVALDIALRSLSIKKGDDVIVSSKSYFISAACVLNLGANPIFSDVSLETQNVELENIKKVLTKKTRAIICVHLGGRPCDIEKIVKFAKIRKIKIIEDCAQAHGASISSKKVGTFGDIGIWSFCNDKIISTGEGGMILTDNKKLWKKIWSYKEGGRNYEKIYSVKKKNIGFNYIHDDLGINSRMTEIQAALGYNHLKKLDYYIKKRNQNAKFLTNIFSKFEFVKIPKQEKNILNAYYRFYIQLDLSNLKNNISRDRILEKLIKNKVPCNEGSCSEIYLEKPFKKLRKFKRLKNAKKLGEISLSFDVNPSLSKKDLSLIKKKINKVFLNIR